LRRLLAFHRSTEWHTAPLIKLPPLVVV
jgi:hypothetical protein